MDSVRDFLPCHHLQTIHEFRTGSVACVVLCLGVVTHWCSMAVVRRDRRVEVVLMDSLNKPVVAATNDDIWEVCNLVCA
jgi:hypothetical protein